MVDRNTYGRFVWAIMALGVLACSDVAPTNPYDPATPVAQQIKSSISGELSLPEGEADISVFDTGIVAIFAQEQAVSQRVERCEAEELDWIVNQSFSSAGMISNGDRAAVFSLIGVPGGVFDFVVCVRGYEPLIIDGLFVERGVDQNMALSLVAATQPDALGYIEGQINLEGAEADGNGQVLVSTVGRPYNAITAENGQFNLMVPSGNYDLSIVRSGFARVMIPNVAVTSGETTLLESVLLNKDKSGRVIGQLSSPVPGDDWLNRTQVQLVGDGATRSASPTVDGLFEFSELTPGLYGLEIRAQGHLEISRFVEVASGTLDLGSIALQPEAVTDDAVFIRGKVRLQDFGPLEGVHDGILIQALIDNQIMGSTVSDINGEFAIVASRLDYRLRFQKQGYDSRSEDITWSEATERFELNGEALENVTELQLSRTPLNGSLSVLVSVGPSWVPTDQRHVRVSVTQLDGEFSRSFEAVEDGQTVTANDLSAGLFAVTLSRPGFQNVTSVPVLLNTINQQVTLPPLSTELIRLADANLNLDGQQLDGCTLRESKADFRGGDFSGAIFVGHLGDDRESGLCPVCANGSADIKLCEPLDLTGASFVNAVFDAEESVSLRGAKLARANFFGANLANVNMENADLRFANFFAVDGRTARFAGADLQSANFTSANLQGAHFVQSNGLHQARMQLEGESNAEITTPHPWAGLAKPMTPLPNSPCGQNGVATNLRGTNFAQANLSNVVMFGVDLSQAILADALITGGDLRHVCLTDTSLNLTDLSYAVLDGADLSGARLINSVLYNTKARGTDFSEANLSSAVIELAQFFPRGSMEDDGIVDEQCATPPPWSDYYPDGLSGGARPSNCDDGIDNDGDGLTDEADLGCDGSVSASEMKSLCASNDSESPTCRCKTSFRGANLNGANLIGARFDDTDLTGATLLGIVTGKSQEFPIRPSAACDQAIVEHCVDACIVDVSGTCGAPGGGLTSAECDGTWSANCRDKQPEGGYSMALLSCTYGQYLAQDALCDRYGDIEGGIFHSCFMEEIFGDLEYLPAEFQSQLPPIQQPPSAKCSQALVKATWRLNQAGEVCADGLSFDQDPSVWTCCPEIYMDNDCTAALTSFSGARLQRAEFTAGNVSGTELLNVDLSQADWSGITMVNGALKGADLSELNARSSRIVNSSMAEANLSGAIVTQSTFDQVDFSGANLNGASFAGSTFLDPRFDDAKTSENGGPTDFTNAELRFRHNLTATRNADLAVLFSGTLADGLKLSGGRFLNSLVEGTLFKNFRFELGIDRSGLTGPQLLNTRFERSRFEGFSFGNSDDDGARGRFDHVYFRRVTIETGDEIEGQSDALVRSVDMNETVFAECDLIDMTWRNISADHTYLFGGSMRGGGMSNVSLTNSVILPTSENAPILIKGFFQLDRSTVSFAQFQFGQSGSENWNLNWQNSRISGTQVFAGEYKPISGQLMNLEVQELTLIGGIEDLSVAGINLGYRNIDFLAEDSALASSQVECSDFEPGGACGATQRCLSDRCYEQCEVDSDCPQGQFCHETLCRQLSLSPSYGLLSIQGDVANSIFTSITGHRLEFRGGYVETDISDLDLNEFNFSGITGGNIELIESKAANFTVNSSNIESLLITDLEVTESTDFKGANFGDLVFNFRPSTQDASAFCGSAVRFVFDEPANLDGADLRGICDLPSQGWGTSIDGATICAEAFENAQGYTGEPILVDCRQRILCPSEPECQ